MARLEKKRVSNNKKVLAVKVELLVRLITLAPLPIVCLLRDAVIFGVLAVGIDVDSLLSCFFFFGARYCFILYQIYYCFLGCR